MRHYTVEFDHPIYGNHSYKFWAKDVLHAEEQLLDAEPSARNLKTIDNYDFGLVVKRINNEED